MANNPSLISIVLPVFNEEEGIQKTVATLESFIDHQPQTFELIFTMVPMIKPSRFSQMLSRTFTTSGLLNSQETSVTNWQSRLAFAIPVVMPWS